MPYKPLDEKIYLQYLKTVGWVLEKGSIDYKVFDENGIYLFSVKIAHGKNTKQEVVAHSVNKTKQKFKERGLKWPPLKKSKNI